MGNVLQDLTNTTLISIFILTINLKDQLTLANLHTPETPEMSTMVSNGALNSKKVLRKRKFNDNSS